MDCPVCKTRINRRASDTKGMKTIYCSHKCADAGRRGKDGKRLTAAERRVIEGAIQAGSRSRSEIAGQQGVSVATVHRINKELEKGKNPNATKRTRRPAKVWPAADEGTIHSL